MTNTIAIEAGKRYRLRNGHVTGVMMERTSLKPDPDRFHTDEAVEGFAPMWREDGKSTFFRNRGDSTEEYYIVEEFTE